MIPHAPPMLFEVSGGNVTLPAEHPLCRDGAYTAAALVELAAQLAGRLVQDAPGHRGMLVEVEGCRLGRVAYAGEVLSTTVTATHRRGPLRRFRVVIGDVLDTGLTLRIA